MILQSLTIPDDSADWGEWLDQQLVSEQLVSTIVELEVIAGNGLVGDQTLDEVVGASIPVILANGLASVSSDVHRKLLRQPSLLMELQERVLIDGGAYWSNRIGSTSPNRSSATSIVDLASNTKSVPPTRLVPRKRSHWLRPLGVVVAVAAMLLLMVFIWPAEQASSGWGLARAGLTTVPRPEDEMLTVLADASHEWFNETPGSTEQLAVRLNEYLDGCQSIIDAKLPQLSDRKRVSVIAACKRCRAAIRKHLNELADGMTLESSLAASNRTIIRLETSIRKLL